MSTPRSVAVAVSGGSGAAKGSRRAVQWAFENVVPQADRFVLVHVIPKITSIPTPGIVSISRSSIHSLLSSHLIYKLVQISLEGKKKHKPFFLILFCNGTNSLRNLI